MNKKQNEDELELFVIEQYNKIKKQKKSPKRFEVIKQFSNLFLIGEMELQNYDENEWKGNLFKLYFLYTDEKENKVEILEDIPFNPIWIPFIKTTLKILFENDEWIYDNMEEEFKFLITKEDFINLVKYSKNK